MAESPQHTTDEELEARLAARRLSRRRFIVGGATSSAAVAGVLGSAALAAPGGVDEHLTQAQAQAQAQPQAQPAPSTTPGFEYFTPFQAAIVSAACARIIPTDDTGPGATEAGVVYFIDRQISGAYGLPGRRYEQGPYARGASTQGDQSGLHMRDRYRLGILGMETYAQQLYQLGFAQLTTDQQDRILHDMESGIPTTFDGASIQSATTGPAIGGTEGGMRQPAPGGTDIGATAFFNLLRSHAIAGFFADPVHGGNRDMVGWKLIGFPGAQMSYTGVIAQYGQPWQGGYKSLGEYQGQYLPS
ncbi:MAG TPA: gluconate 2-dehydrogenase subunit 3 family protein [Chloroflexota bacterium]|jgi:gluconate 2-dehydrogenase gamma chain|nr:gluconate 2-dehydrogenase subunit 3 family protein [Chloroflexota bacterium]